MSNFFKFIFYRMWLLLYSSAISLKLKFGSSTLVFFFENASGTYRSWVIAVYIQAHFYPTCLKQHLNSPCLENSRASDGTALAFFTFRGMKTTLKVSAKSVNQRPCTLRVSLFQFYIRNVQKNVIFFSHCTTALFETSLISHK